MAPVIREGALLACAALAVYLLVALASYHPDDPNWVDTGQGGIRNAAGQVGAGLAGVLLSLAGRIAYLIPVMLGYAGWLFYHQRRMVPEDMARRRWGVSAVHWLGFAMTLGSACALAGIYAPAEALPVGGGGLIGQEVAGMFIAAFNAVGATVLLLALLLTGVTLWTGFSWLRAVDAVGRFFWNLGSLSAAAVRRAREYWAGRHDRQQREERRVRVRQRRKERKEQTRIEPKIRIEPDIKRIAREKQRPLPITPPASTELPPLDLLDKPLESSAGYSEETLNNMSQQIEMKMEEFKVEVSVVAVTPGPIVTRFDLEPAPGVRGSKISSYAKDLARALSVVSIRVEEVVEGKSVIGLEVPNDDREMVLASEILRSAAFNKSSSLLTLALGKSINGQPVVCDLAKMPHLLVAGTTGSGKSVAVNTMIMSLLYKALPTELRLILIDPKMLELGIYEGISHLLTPVVTDMKQAANALLWCVGEMERRYTVMAKLGVRNLDGYNSKVKKAEQDGEPLRDPTAPAPAADADAEAAEEAPLLKQEPYIVVVIDEFADMMMVVGKKVEEYIIRLAQKARAAGIHLILATQRPTREVVTGLIKSNIPARISFRVASNVDSRTILDQIGAEQLLGHGDMLFMDAGSSLPQRVHGAFISIDEVSLVTKHLRDHGGEPNYLDEVVQEGSILLPGQPDESGGDGEADPLYQQAVEVVVRDRKASVSYLQRRLKIGYNRAARMIEEMEEAGIVGAVQSSGAREVLAPEPDDA